MDPTDLAVEKPIKDPSKPKKKIAWDEETIAEHDKVGLQYHLTKRVHGFL
jgi:hypothetical protein